VKGNAYCAERQTGFTMVELITSIVIIGILAATIGPKFIGNLTFSQRGYTDEVAAALRYAQAVAVASGCSVRVTLTNTSYEAMQPGNEPPACGGAWTTVVPRVDGGNLAGTAPNGVTLGPARQITFNAQGRIANTTPVVLRNSGFVLTISANSGFVSVQAR
jgi:MSHA pilin protein MshC